jgi:hypothetical protein
MAEETGRINASVSKVSGIGNSNKTCISALAGELAKFKIE